MITMKEFTKKMKGKPIEILYSNGNRERIEVSDAKYLEGGVGLYDGTFNHKLSLDAAAELYSKGSCMYKGCSYIVKRRKRK